MEEIQEKRNSVEEGQRVREDKPARSLIMAVQEEYRPDEHTLPKLVNVEPTTTTNHENSEDQP